MTINHAINKFAKNGISLTRDESRSAECYNQRFGAFFGAYRVEILTQGGDVATMRAAKRSDADEFESDYFGGSFFDTIPQLLFYVRS